MLILKESRMTNFVYAIIAFFISSTTFAESSYWKLNQNHIESQKALETFSFKKKIVIAVIDTGIDYSHPFLKDVVVGDNLQKATADNYGLDFTSFFSGTKPKDNHGHGTHIAGIIKNVFPDVKLLSLKYFDPKKDNNTLNATLKALEFAIEQNVDIINYSGGGAEYSSEEFELMKKAEKKGILVVAAAGNDSLNLDDKKNKFYPASYNLSNVISVANHDSSLDIAFSSNYGKMVDIAAPGDKIYSTKPNGGYGFLTGTSQATAFVSGVAAMIKSHQPSLKAQEIKSIIKYSGIKTASLSGRVFEGRRLNAYKAILVADKFIELSNEKKRNIASRKPSSVENNWDKKMIKSSKIKIDSQNTVVVGIIDTGVDAKNDVIKNRLWINKNEKLDGIDNDNNGYIDDISGFDFVANSGVIKDLHGHGTHIAGIISSPFSPVNNSKILFSSYRYYFSDNNEELFNHPLFMEYKTKVNPNLTEFDPNQLKSNISIQNSNNALKLAIDHGVDVINYSGGGYSSDAQEELLLKKALEKNIVVVVAAGNGEINKGQGVNMDDEAKYYPCAYNLENIICVNNVNHMGHLSSSSNYGLINTHIGAPGEKILSIGLEEKLKELSGTSQATAYISNLVALIKLKNNKLTAKEIKHLIINTATEKPALRFKNISDGVVNFAKALENVDNSKMMLPSDNILKKITMQQRKMVKERKIGIQNQILKTK